MAIVRRRRIVSPSWLAPVTLTIVGTHWGTMTQRLHNDTEKKEAKKDRMKNKCCQIGVIVMRRCSAVRI